MPVLKIKNFKRKRGSFVSGESTRHAKTVNHWWTPCREKELVGHTVILAGLAVTRASLESVPS